MRYKYVVRFVQHEIPLLEEALLLLKDNYAATDEKKFFKIDKIINRLYIDEQKSINGHIHFLENRGYKIEKSED